jgi:gliding motility-associated-like protein
LSFLITFAKKNSMKYKLFLILFLFYFSLFAQNKNGSVGFIENKGQIIDQKGKPNPAVKYLLNTSGLNVQIKKTGFAYDVYEIKKHPLSEKQKEKLASNFLSASKELPQESLEYLYHRIDIDFVNSNKNTQVIADDKSEDYDNFYNVIHAPQGITNVHKFKKITYQNVYNNIDVVFFIPKDTTKVVEYNFIVRPKGKVSDIQLKFTGVKTELDHNKIKMVTRFGNMEETMPMSWTEEGEDKKEINIGYKKIKDNVYGFDCADEVYDKTVIIDPVPVRLWGTFYGYEENLSNQLLLTGGIATDALNNIYLTGNTGSSNLSYATVGAHQTSVGNEYTPYLLFRTDVIVVKFSPEGNREWGTYYGGNLWDRINVIKTDSNNNVIIAGITDSTTNISTVGSYSPNLNGSDNNFYSDGFLVKFNASGVRIWGTYFGGESGDQCYSIDTDENDNIYVVGRTESKTNIAIKSNFQTQWNQGISFYDGYLAKFDTDGHLNWSTYVGGEGWDDLKSIVVKGNYLITGGYSFSYNNITTSGVFQSVHNSNSYYQDGTIYKFSLDGQRLWSTYYGGDFMDEINALEIDEEDNIYLGGQTQSPNNIATIDGFDNSDKPSYRGFFAKLNSNGQRIWGSYLGSSTFPESGNISSLEFRNNALYLGASEGSRDPNLTNSCSYKPQVTSIYEDYIGKFSKRGEFIWGTYVGGFDPFSRIKIVLDNNNKIVVGGISSINEGITDSNSYQSYISGYKNFYLMKFSEGELLCNIDINPTSNSPICTGNILSFNNVPSGYVYAWTGPNGYTSSDPNPIINNASSINSGLYTLVVSDGIDCGCKMTYKLDVFVGDNVPPVPDVKNLPDITGDCNTIVTTIPAALDACAGNIVGTTLDPLSYTTGGNYIIHWNYDDGNGNISSQNQNVIIAETQVPILISSQLFCTQKNATLNDIIITGQNIQWYDDMINGNLLSNSKLLTDGMIYYASQTINNCESKTVPVTINIQNTQTPTGSNQSFCLSQKATLNDIVVNGANIKWYDTNTSTTILSSSTILLDGVTYYATQTINGCESVIRLPVTISLINTLNANNFDVEFCDDLNNGSKVINLTNYNNNLIASATNSNFKYYNSLIGATNQVINDQITADSNYILGTGTKTIFVRITSINGCHQIVELQLTLQPTPIININDIVPICEKSNITINAGTGFDSYLWSTGEITPSIEVTTPGSYSVVVTQKHTIVSCSSTKKFTVVNSNPDTILQIITSDWTTNENSITIVLTTGNVGVYEYSLDGINYQESNTFSGLESGEYNVFMRDKNGCGVIKDTVYLLMYPKFFTPNGDGFNDIWRIKFPKNESNATVKIFDRFGKLLKEISSLSEGWNGTFNGQELPSADYWFTVIRANGKEYKGHFALKR